MRRVDLVGPLNLLKRSRVVWVAAISGALGLLLSFSGGTAGWAAFFRFIFYSCLIILAFRGVRSIARRMTWSLRNRLLIAYLFVAVVPIVLILAMAGVAIYLFYGQYAADLLVEEVNNRVARVKVLNDVESAALQQVVPTLAAETALAKKYVPQGAVATYIYDSAERPLLPGSPPLPRWLPPDFHGLVVQPNRIVMAAYSAVGKRRLLTLVPLDADVINELTDKLGYVQPVTRRVDFGTGNSVEYDARLSSSWKAPYLFPAGTRSIAPATNAFDMTIQYFTPLTVTDWGTGESRPMFMSIHTRPSILNAQLFRAEGVKATEFSRWPLWLLGGIGAVFLVIEAISLIAGISTTRFITRAVSDLYKGTQYINAGNFDYRIPVRTKDQLAELENSFNAMADSIRRLLTEQKQKQRLENELSIAQEVQAQLFPRNVPSIRGLELHGVCLPARAVSGDYYDFIELPEERIGLALGDISGKGISAALLMATLSSAIRAHETRTRPVVAATAVGNTSVLEPLPAAMVSTASLIGELTMVSTASLMRDLNEQLFRSTAPEKYATLFYGVYDGRNRRLQYTNAGHLPPIVLKANGERLRLDAGGMVIGLFSDAEYEYAEVTLSSGDMLVAWSDGITEPENEYGVEFGEDRLVELVIANRNRSLDAISSAVLSAVRDWSIAQEQPDDVTLLLARAV